ncbi:hypothetical protein EYC98_04400 [Halieaceae bacterium IMCC14734]|uniref:L,D-TPase catalytic domain-containing protein n=1 Tax=Candidatus Litorirhabdus singularis TaxID=2518993 RepID=A0ABT3TDN4_9GAMM|nr:L,D-transpeptidase family protein [Candidatus Litorirhabdus singularis]MCX2980104.1 hypothetical protein [Candidatus Litorirhabdus singularis]
MKNYLIQLSLALATTVFALHASALDPSSSSAEIEVIMDEMLSGQREHFHSVSIETQSVLSLLYESRDYRPAWADQQVTLDILGLLRDSYLEGLDPNDYHYDHLLEMADQLSGPEPPDGRALASFDVLLSDAVLLYARHMLEGKVNPEPVEYAWNYSRRDFLPENIVQNLNAAIENKTAVSILRNLPPGSWFYQQLRDSLAFYRAKAAGGEAPPLSTHTVLRPGDSGAAVAALRNRLVQLEFHPDMTLSKPEFFGSRLQKAVAQFQAMHGLDADGIVGAKSYQELNIPAAARVQQIRINMDRIRWIQDDVNSDFVVVNIPGFELYYIENNQVSWRTEVVAGKVTTETPMFKAQIKYLVVNPTWTVPASIIRRSLFHKFATDPAYARDNNFLLYDRDGNEVPTDLIPWDQVSAARFPYRVVQQPGPKNALGTIKFMFPNRHAIYLHDTPNRELFQRTSRAFSAGCVRVENPLEFADRLLGGTWEPAAIQAAVDSAELQVIHLPEPIDVLLMYWTASPTASGRIKFNPDIYNRDPAVIKRLNAPPVWKNI